MQNIMYLMLLLSVKALTLIDANNSTDCKNKTYPDIKNADIIHGDQCEDIKIRCQEGYQMKQLMTCINDTWIFQNPECTPDSGCVIQDRNIKLDSINLRVGNNYECNQECGNRETCGTFSYSCNFTNSNCFLLYQPVIYYKAYITELDCIERCNEIPACLTLSYGGSFQGCVLFNDTLEQVLIAPNHTAIDEKGFIIAGKTECPSYFMI